MDTIIKKINDVNRENVISKGAQILRNGGTVAFPTETVYGIGADALDEEAVKKIFKAKGRPSDNPLIAHVANEEDIYDLIVFASEDAKKLMEKFWPGPLTLIFKKSEIVPLTITGGLDTVALRMPLNKVARQLIKEAGRPIAAPSANTSGKPSPTKAKHVIDDLEGRVDMIIDDGNCAIGLESTVLDVSSDKPMILRPGAVTKKMLEEVIGEVLVDETLKSGLGTDIVPKAPGMKYKHYSPKADVTIIAGKLADVITYINQKIKNSNNEKIGIMATKQTENKYNCQNVLSLGDRNTPDKIAANLFDTLRKFDEIGVEVIYAEAINEENIGDAIMNRMTKAAGYKIINV